MFIFQLTDIFIGVGIPPTSHLPIQTPIVGIDWKTPGLEDDGDIDRIGVKKWPKSLCAVHVWRWKSMR